MSFEVEQKFPAADAAAIEKQLSELGVELGPPTLQVDQYFAHPCKSFAETDEALRIRRVGESNFVTYKGPKLDKQTKTRREIELPLEAGDKGAGRFASLLDALGFKPVFEVRKRRRKAAAPWEGSEVEVALDEVEGLGAFAELEIVAEENEVEAAKKRLASLAERLGLEKSERRSYLEMLLERAGKL